jgi:general stress protein 26
VTSAPFAHREINRPLLRKAAMSTTSQLTAEDLEFLARPLHGFLSVAAGPLPPQPRPVWFEATAAGTVQFFTGPETLKVRRLRSDPRASLVVAAPVGERERWVSVAGRTTVETDGARELAARLAARYWDLDDPGRAAELAEILAADQVRVVLHAETVHRYAN